jgi:ADP-heptose:LPS heptosyltransferase
MNDILDKYFIIYRNTDSIGDQLLISAILEKVKEKYNKPIILFITHPELFFNNPFIYKVINYKKLTRDDIYFLFKDTIYENDHQTGILLLMNKIRKTKSEYICEFAFPWMNKKNAHIKKSLVEFYSQKLNIQTFGTKPELYLTEIEKKCFKEKFNLPQNYYLIHSEGIRETEFKNYGVEKMRKIIDLTKDKINWIQIGLENDRKLNGTKFNLSGKLNLRELFCCVYYCGAMLSIHGFQTLIASAFNKKNYCIISDYQYQEQTPYDNIIYIKRDNFHNEPCDICYAWYCGCKKSKKFGWQNDIKPEYIASIILNDITK